MSSQKYLAAVAAGIVVIGAVWLFSAEKRAAIAPLLSSKVSAPMPGKPLVVDSKNESASSATPQDVQRLKVLDEILTAKNDNDPRLDSEFRNLSVSSKRMMEERYHSLPQEKRNERGTIVFLVGREISSIDDVVFIGSVLSEPPCLSLGDCSREEKDIDDAHLHAETGEGVSLAYPQLVALHAIEAQLERAERGAKPAYLDEIRKVVDSASRSPIPRVADTARGLLTRIKGLSG